MVGVSLKNIFFPSNPWEGGNPSFPPLYEYVISSERSSICYIGISNGNSISEQAYLSMYNYIQANLLLGH